MLCVFTLNTVISKVRSGSLKRCFDKCFGSVGEPLKRRKCSYPLDLGQTLEDHMHEGHNIGAQGCYLAGLCSAISVDLFHVSFESAPVPLYLQKEGTLYPHHPGMRSSSKGIKMGTRGLGSKPVVLFVTSMVCIACVHLLELG